MVIKVALPITRRNITRPATTAGIAFSFNSSPSTSLYFACKSSALSSRRNVFGNGLPRSRNWANFSRRAIISPFRSNSVFSTSDILLPFGLNFGKKRSNYSGFCRLLVGNKRSKFAKDWQNSTACNKGKVTSPPHQTDLGGNKVLILPRLFCQ